LEEKLLEEKPLINFNEDVVDLREFSTRELYQSAYVEFIGSFFFAFLG